MQFNKPVHHVLLSVTPEVYISAT
uniref:Uncharacterized protein n=1 Tax=Anguilla anguilla TaxID=7936 RepID=A0A0E9Q9P7_ANGAN